jgi:hypothetical protein
MTVTFVGGGGTVGSTAAYTLAVDRPHGDLRLCDVDVDCAVVAGGAIDPEPEVREAVREYARVVPYNASAAGGVIRRGE